MSPDGMALPILLAQSTYSEVAVFVRVHVAERPGSVGPDPAFVPQLFQDEPDGLVAHTWHCRPDVGETERDRRVAQDVLAGALLLGPGSLGRGRAGRRRRRRHWRSLW